MPSEPTNTPDWVQPDAEVLLYTVDQYGSRHLVKTTIKRVNTGSFTVSAQQEPRFRLPQCRADTDDSWHRWTRYCVPFDSDAARRELDALRKRKLVVAARYAVEVWLKNKTRDNRLAAIAALQAVEDEAVHGVE
jgi:hypothetical protein